MYTQCPDCSATFHVTPAVLQQAAGNVRCGGCGHAFNALERLSEALPDESGGGFADEQSKALLDSLDEITGTDNIRIEDTGVEWRVLDEDPESAESENGDSGRPADSPGLKDAGRPQPGDETGALRWRIEDAAGDPQDREMAGEAAPEPAAASADSPTSGTSVQEPLDLLQPDVERYDDNTPVAGALDDDAEGSFAVPDTPRRRAEDLLEPRSPELDERQVDLALSEPDDWTDLLDEVVTGPGDDAPIEIATTGDEAVAEAVTAEYETDPGIAPADDEAGGTDGTGTRGADFPSDIDTQFDLQALEMGIGTGGEFDPTGEEPILDADELTLVEADDELMLAEDDETVDPGETGDFPIAVEDDDAVDFLSLDDTDDSREGTGEFERRIALAAEALARDDSDDDGDVEPGAGTPAPDMADTGHYVPPQTEEEMTINRLIDQDLLRLAAEEQGLAATSGGMARPSQRESPHVETIIMEGDFVRNSLEGDLQSADPGIGIDVESPADDTGPSLRDTYIRTRNRLSGARPKADPPRYHLIAGAAVLALLLAAQVVHAYRESLATFGTFDRTIGSLYRFFGAPITPDWDANAWQFETTSGSTDAFDRVLTISSRIANRSNHALPYPLLHVSLTDRYEEIIGSSLLEPDQYLAEATNRDNVAPGDKFTATVTVASLSPEATGYKLNVCYRTGSEQVHCATGVFKE